MLVWLFVVNFLIFHSQAEDVMGSILKDYLNDSRKQDEIQSASETSDKVDSVAEDKDISVDKISHSNKLDSEESKNHELENVKTAAECLDSSVQEPGNQLQSPCTSESLDPPKRCFKNVVAIVDPPRGGLHPTVSKRLHIPYHYFDFYLNLCGVPLYYR